MFLFAADEVGRVFRGPAGAFGPGVPLLFPAHFAGLRRRMPGRFVVDIGEALEKKMAAIACYESQFPPEKAERLDFIRVLAQQQGMAAGSRPARFWPARAFWARGT